MDDAFANLVYGFSIALQWDNLLWALVGVAIGNLIGVLPGLGVMASVSILLPLSYSLMPTSALMMLAGVYYGAMYGNGITSILLNLPGTSSSAVVCLDGYPLARQGKAGSALFMMIMGSFVGAIAGIAALVLLAPVLSEIAFEFGPAEYFSMMILGLLAGATLGKGSAIKGVAMVVVGLIMGTVGIDVTSGTPRFTFGILELSDGLQLVALAMGLFGVAEFLINVNRIGGEESKIINNSVSVRSMRPAPGDIKKSAGPAARGSLIGAILGALPGTGSTIASFIAYAVEKRVAKEPRRFGRGAIEGVVAPEASSSAAAQAGFIPTLSLGIPGDPVMALMLGALMIHGIQPGPQLITSYPDIFWGLIASFWIGNIILVILNVPLIGMWTKLLSVPYRNLFPAAMFFVCVGGYSVDNSMFTVGTLLVFGLLGYVFIKLKLGAAPLLLGFVLGPMIEENFQRALLLSRGDLMTFIDRPISAGFVLASVLLVVWLFSSAIRGRRVSPSVAS